MYYLDTYLKYAGAGENEVPIIFHRWVSLSIIGAIVGRKIWLPFGMSRIYPNQYIMLMGAPGTRKSTAINIGTKLLKRAGYDRFAPDKVSKERFLICMSAFDPSNLDTEELLDCTLNEPSEIYIAAEEFGDFIQAGDNGFPLMLTKLWDNPDEYTHPKINGADVTVNEPTVNMIAGNTPKTFTDNFPPEALGNGFLSRLLFIYGEDPGRRVAFPPLVDEELQRSLVSHLKDIKTLGGEIGFKDLETKQLLTEIYKHTAPMEDERFANYHSRRFTHLLKLCCTLAICDLRLAITVEDVLKANGLLHMTEARMPLALGEYGKSKFSEVMGDIVQFIQTSHRPPSTEDIWKRVHKDLTKQGELFEILKGLQAAERVEYKSFEQRNGVKKRGWVCKDVVKETWKAEFVDTSWLHLEEMS